MAKPIYKCREEREPIAMMADASRRRPPAQDNDGSTQWGNGFAPTKPAPTPNKHSRLSGVGYNGAPCPLRRLTVGGLTVTAPVVGVLRCPAIAFSPLRIAPDRLYRLP